MHTHVDLDPADLMALGISFLGEPLSPDRAFVWIGKERSAASRPTAIEARRIAASWHALADEIDRRTFERGHAPISDRAFGDGTCPADPDGMHSSDCGHDVEDGRDVESASYQAAAS